MPTRVAAFFFRLHSHLHQSDNSAMHSVSKIFVLLSAQGVRMPSPAQDFQQLSPATYSCIPVLPPDGRCVGSCFANFLSETGRRSRVRRQSEEGHSSS